jgi:magnesium transporter
MLKGFVMIKYFKLLNGIKEIENIEPNCWINVIEPTQEELDFLKTNLHLPSDVVNDILDPDEVSHIEYEDDYTLIILRIPIYDLNKDIPYFTIPLGIFITKDYLLTLCAKENEILSINEAAFNKKYYKNITDKLNFILKIFLRTAKIYLRYLKQINKYISLIQKDLEQSIKNKELIDLLKMEKCLVYFITSIRANEIILSKIDHSKKAKSEINEDLLEDAIIENKQALTMAQIYSDILSGMMDAFASVISNNLNIIMKQLTSISIILMIPTVIYSLFGMNVPLFIENKQWALPLIIIGSMLLSYLGVVLFKKKEWF